MVVSITAQEAVIQFGALGDVVLEGATPQTPRVVGEIALTVDGGPLLQGVEGQVFIFQLPLQNVACL